MVSLVNYFSELIKNRDEEDMKETKYILTKCSNTINEFI